MTTAAEDRSPPISRLRRLRRVLCLSSLLLLAAPGVARAQGAGDDEVSLKNGGMVRGTVVAVEPDREVTVLVPGGGEPRHIPWAQVDKVTRGKYAAQAAPVAPPPMPLAPPPGPPVVGPAPGRPRLHVVSDSPEVQVQEITSQTMGAVWTGSGSAWATLTTFRPVCNVPCDQPIDERPSYFFNGPGIPASTPFQIAGRGPEVHMDVKAGSTGLRGGGIAVMSLGGAGIAAGAAMVAIGSITTPSFDSTTFQEIPGQPNHGLITGGGVAIGVGVAALAGGIVMIILGRTTYSFVGPGQQAGTLKWTF
jgi:hypothetical protein